MTSPTLPTTVTLPAPGRYRVDPAQTTISFETRHLFGLGGVKGSFRLTEGEIVVGEPVTATTLHAVIDAGSFDSANPQRDKKVKGPQFLDADKHTEITVVGTGVSQVDGAWIASGTVTAHGTAAPLTLKLDHLADDNGRLTFRAVAKIDRYAHGVTTGKGMAGRWLNVTVEAVAEA